MRVDKSYTRNAAKLLFHQHSIERKTDSLARSGGMESSGLPRDMVSSFRTGTTKSRNGCIVCKIRRVKCDETKPCCLRCTSTGRTCEGYGQAPARNKSKSPSRSPPRDRPTIMPSPPIVYSPSTDVQASVEERRSFHYFRSRNMSDMPGNFEPYFWNHIVLQFSHKYPTILQALVALSAIYEDHERKDSHPKKAAPESYAMLQYNKAVKDLVKYLAADNQDPTVALTTCLIFVWIEFLQDNMYSGFQQLNCGLKILRDCVGAQNRDVEDILGSLSRSFTRLRIQGAIHGAMESEFTTSTTRELEVLESIPDSFANVFESRIILDQELNAIFGYIRVLREMDYYSDVSMDMFKHFHKGHVDRLEQWQRATKNLVAELETKQDQIQTSGILYLQMYYLCVSIVWTTIFSGTEMAFDAFTEEFEAIITIATTLMGNPQFTAPQVLSFDMGIIPPLFFLGVKCRVLRLRKQAIALMKRAPEREGLWHRDSIVEYCEWKAMTEEGWRGDVPEDEPLPEYARMYAEHVSEGDGYFIRNGETFVRFSFRRGPLGLDIQDTIEVPGGSELMKQMGNLI